MATYDPRQTFKAQELAFSRAAGTQTSKQQGLSVGAGTPDDNRGSTYDEVPQVITSSPLPGLGSRTEKKDKKEKTFMEKVYDFFVGAGADVTEPEKDFYAMPVYESPMFKIPAVPEVTEQGIKDPFDQFDVNPFNFGSSMGIDPNDPRGRDQRALPQNTYQSTINTFLTGGGRDDFVKGSYTTPRGLMAPPTMDQPNTPEPLINIPRALAKSASVTTAKYRVQDGDTLSEIADATGSTVQELADLNMINDVDVIRAGADLEIPIRRIKDKDVVTKAKSMEELKPIKASYRVSEPSLELDTTDPDSEFYSSFRQGITPPEMMQTTGDETYASADYMSELEILARTIEAEAGGESKTGKLAVASVIKNRADQNRFGKDIRSVILFPSQFSPWNKYTNSAGGKQGKDMLGAEMKPSQDSYDAAKQVLSGKYIDPTGGATHFVNPKEKEDVSWYKPFVKNKPMRIGNHQFGSPDNPNWQYSSGIDKSLRPPIKPLGRS